MYDRTQSQEILRRLTRGQYNPQEQIDRLPSGVQRNFNLELKEQLKGWDYDSNTIIEESLNNAADAYFKGVNWRLRQSIKSMFNQSGYYETLDYYTELIEKDKYKTLDIETLKEYVDTLNVMSNISFFD